MRQHEPAPGRAAFPPLQRRDVLRLRGPKNAVSSERPYAILHEVEPTGAGTLAAVNVLFLTVSECPLACVFCDLWKNTLDTPTPRGAVARQIDWAHGRLPALIRLSNRVPLPERWLLVEMAVPDRAILPMPGAANGV